MLTQHTIYATLQLRAGTRPAISGALEKMSIYLPITNSQTLRPVSASFVCPECARCGTRDWDTFGWLLFRVI